MNWASQRKFKYISAVIGSVVIIIGLFVYFNYIRKEETCSDKVQNQNERGVDCGGICSLMCISDVRPLIPLWTRPVKITGDVYSVVSYIENQNTGNGVKKVPYEIRLFDDRNVLVAEPITGTTFIGPNDRTAIFETGIKTGNRNVKTAFLKFTESPQFYRTEEFYNNQNIVVEKDELTEVETEPKLSAVLKNVTLETLVQIPVVALIYDTTGNIIGASQTFVEELGPEESITVYFSWPEPFNGVAARREVIPRLNPFVQKLTL